VLWRQTRGLLSFRCWRSAQPNKELLVQISPGLIACALALSLAGLSRAAEPPSKEAAPSGAQAAASESQSNGPDPAELFGRLDADKDGQLTAGEVPPDKRRLFERLLRTSDKNHDGKLSAEEFVAGLKPAEPKPPVAAEQDAEGRKPEGLSPERMFLRLDANNDGKVTPDEVPEPRRERFKQLLRRGDRDGDGALDREEFVAVMTAVMARQGAGGAKRPQGRPDGKRLFARLDKNGDGKLTADEVPQERRAFVERMIRRGDKNNDQALSLEEFESIRPR
jgi:Ca2+-binding EF-hand superfamily protein